MPDVGLRVRYRLPVDKSAYPKGYTQQKAPRWAGLDPLRCRHGNPVVLNCGGMCSFTDFITRKRGVSSMPSASSG